MPFRAGQDQTDPGVGVGQGLEQIGKVVPVAGDGLELVEDQDGGSFGGFLGEQAVDVGEDRFGVPGGQAGVEAEARISRWRRR